MSHTLTTAQLSEALQPALALGQEANEVARRGEDHPRAQDMFMQAAQLLIEGRFLDRAPTQRLRDQVRSVCGRFLDGAEEQKRLAAAEATLGPVGTMPSAAVQAPTPAPAAPAPVVPPPAPAPAPAPAHPPPSGLPVAGVLRSPPTAEPAPSSSSSSSSSSTWRAPAAGTIAPAEATAPAAAAMAPTRSAVAGAGATAASHRGGAVAPAAAAQTSTVTPRPPPQHPATDTTDTTVATPPAGRGATNGSQQPPPPLPLLPALRLPRLASRLVSEPLQHVICGAKNVRCSRCWPHVADATLGCVLRCCRPALCVWAGSRRPPCCDIAGRPSPGTGAERVGGGSRTRTRSAPRSSAAGEPPTPRPAVTAITVTMRQGRPGRRSRHFRPNLWEVGGWWSWRRCWRPPPPVTAAQQTPTSTMVAPHTDGAPYVALCGTRKQGDLPPKLVAAAAVAVARVAQR
jgi:hypothetical protein